MDSAAYNKLVEQRTANHQPLPPAKYIKEAGHHWLAYRNPVNGGGMTSEIRVAQWSPTQHCWYHSNELATCAKPIGIDGLLTDWEWVAYIPVPEII